MYTVFHSLKKSIAVLPISRRPTPVAFNTRLFLRALHLQLVIGVRGRGLPGDQTLFGAHPRDRADLILSVLEQLRISSPGLYATAAVRGVPT